MTTEQLKEILKHMKGFTPIAMKCTQEQFDAVKPKLKGLEIGDIKPFTDCKYLVNNLGGESKVISNFRDYAKICFDREVHEEWNEEVFLKACGIEAETLQEKEQRLLNELNEVKQQIEEENKIKVDDWVVINKTNTIFKVKETDFRFIDDRHKKITNTELIKLLEQEIK